MAGTVHLKHPQTGIVKNGFYGFSWTTFFFGGFPALLRGDILYGLGVLILGLLASAFSFGVLWFVVSVIWAFVYNRNYTHRLLQQGYRFDDTDSRVAHARHALGVR